LGSSASTSSDIPTDNGGGGKGTPSDEARQTGRGSCVVWAPSAHSASVRPRCVWLGVLGEGCGAAGSLIGCRQDGRATSLSSAFWRGCQGSRRLGTGSCSWIFLSHFARSRGVRPMLMLVLLLSLALQSKCIRASVSAAAAVLSVLCSDPARDDPNFVLK